METANRAQPIEPQTFPAFERDGFTVVEWGGCEVTKSKNGTPFGVPFACCYAVIFLKLFPAGRRSEQRYPALHPGDASFFLSRRLDGNTVDIAFHGSGKILAHLTIWRRES